MWDLLALPFGLRLLKMRWTHTAITTALASSSNRFDAMYTHICAKYNFYSLDKLIIFDDRAWLAADSFVNIWTHSQNVVHTLAHTCWESTQLLHIKHLRISANNNKSEPCRTIIGIKSIYRFHEIDFISVYVATAENYMYDVWLIIVDCCYCGCFSSYSLFSSSSATCGWKFSQLNLMRTDVLNI